MIRTRKKTAPGSADAAAAADADSAAAGNALPELPGPLTDEATAGEFDAAAEAFASHERGALASAEQAETQARHLEAAARAEIERITRETQAEVNRLRWTVARNVKQEAAQHRERAGYLAEAARCKTRAAETARRGMALAEEREGLAARADGLSGRLAALDAEQRDLAGRLAAAREAADAASITSLRGEIAGHEEAREVLAGQLAGVRARMDAIGADGGTGEVFDALGALRRDTARARELVNLAWPERPEAVADRKHAELLGALQGNLDRIAGERRAAQQPQRPNFVRI